MKKKTPKALIVTKREIEVVYFGIVPNSTIDKRNLPIQRKKEPTGIKSPMFSFPHPNDLEVARNTKILSKLQETRRSYR